MIAGPGGLEPRVRRLARRLASRPRRPLPRPRPRPRGDLPGAERGEFSQDDGPWFEPGIGGSFHNTPGIRHAMRAGAEPLFAVWALWAG